jgi:YD repeat-containing protein
MRTDSAEIVTSSILIAADARTGVPLYSFSYNSAGQLTGITDVNDELTRILRDGQGNPRAIAAPFARDEHARRSGAVGGNSPEYRPDRPPESDLRHGEAAAVTSFDRGRPDSEASLRTAKRGHDPESL